MGVALLEGLDLGLDAHHLERGLHHHEAGGQHEEVEDDGNNDDGPSPVVDAGAQPFMEVAQGQVEGLGDDGEPAELGKRLQRGPGGLAVCAGGANGLEHIGFFWAGKEAYAGQAAGVSDGHAQHFG